MDQKKSLSCPLSGSEVEGDKTTGGWRKDEGHSLPAVTSVPPCKSDEKCFQLF